jgi:hypothetical protein
MGASGKRQSAAGERRDRGIGFDKRLIPKVKATERLRRLASP